MQIKTCSHDLHGFVGEFCFSLRCVKDSYPNYVLYKDGSFMGNYEGIPAVRIEDWLITA